MKSEYLILLGLILVFPLIFSFDAKLGLYKHGKVLWYAIIGMSVPFWIWDAVAAARGHWWFNEQYITGLQWLGLPVEEWLFFPIVGFVSVFTWESTRYFLGRRKRR
jgi:lycopene cyclase domain-containing protein